MQTVWPVLIMIDPSGVCWAMHFPEAVLSGFFFVHTKLAA